MTFHIITLFPEAIEPYLKSSVVGKAASKGLVKIKYYNLMDFTPRRDGRARPERSRRVDDRPYGGGPGMVIQIESIVKAVQFARSKIKSQKLKVILFSAGGKQISNKTTIQLAQHFKHLILVCGRYEGIDGRVKKVLKDQKLLIEELSVGPYVLTGGELPAMILVDAVSRQLKGVLGKEESLEEKRQGIGVPAYTRPEVFSYRGRKYKVPRILLSGDHAKILSWRLTHRKRQS